MFIIETLALQIILVMYSLSCQRLMESTVFDANNFYNLFYIIYKTSSFLTVDSLFPHNTWRTSLALLHSASDGRPTNTSNESKLLIFLRQFSCPLAQLLSSELDGRVLLKRLSGWLSGWLAVVINAEVAVASVAGVAVRLAGCYNECRSCYWIGCRRCLAVVMNAEVAVGLAVGVAVRTVLGLAFRVSVYEVIGITTGEIFLSETIDSALVVLTQLP